jgi:hypothetical protein
MIGVTMKALLCIGSVALCVLAAACTKQQNKCTKDSDCTNVAYPFCDVNGEFAASGGEKNVCTIVPPDCPVERCGCSPGATSCGSNTLMTCDPGGMSQTSTACALGCATDGTRCLSFVPPNGLGPALTAAGNAQAVQIPAGAQINTDTGVVKDSASLPVQISSLVVTQGSSSIRVFIAKSFTIADVTVFGTNAVAFVAADTLDLTGVLSARGAGSGSGPGAQTTGACVGGAGDLGGAGGGNATVGGDGAFQSVTLPYAHGGAVVAGFEPLVGGCQGGAQTNNGSTVASGGGGGGAVQLVAGTTLTISGKVDVDAGGGASAAGGGSGGAVVLVAPRVAFTGGVFANGGGGGACGTQGADGTDDLNQAGGGGPCGTIQTRQRGGAGGTAGAASTSGLISTTGAAGGGGAVGRLQVLDLDGTFDSSAGVVSAAVTTGQLQPQ